MMGDTSYTLPIGPVHPALKEPTMFQFTIEGEVVTDVDVRPGINHRGIEFIGMRRNVIQTLHLAERICGICSIVHQYAFTMAAERAAGVFEVPERAQYIRMIMAELERLHSHLLWAGVAAHELGFDTLLHLSWKVREDVQDVLELISGNRVNYAMYYPGGVRRDIPSEKVPRIKAMLKHYAENFQMLADTFLDDPVIKHRTVGVGVLTKKDAIETSTVGPTARASGVYKDTRFDQPYEAYADVDIKPVLPSAHGFEDAGDVYAGIVVRLFEVAQSLEIINYALDNMPSGPYRQEMNVNKVLMMLKKADGEGFAMHEAPRGEMCHYVRLKENEDNIDCWKVRASTYNNILAWQRKLIGQQIADVSIVAASIDPCIGCMDRVAIVDARTGKETMMTEADFHRLSVEKSKRLRK